MQKVSSGEGRQVLDGGVPGGMQKEFKGEGRHVGELLGVAGGMQNELSGVGRQPLLGGLVGGLLLGAVGAQPPTPGMAVPSTHDPPPLTPIGVARKHPTGDVSQIWAVWVTDVLGEVLDGMLSTSVPSTTSAAELPMIVNVQLTDVDVVVVKRRTPVHDAIVAPLGAVGAIATVSPGVTAPRSETVHVICVPGSGMPSGSALVHVLWGTPTAALAWVDERIVVTPMASDPASTTTPRARRIRLPRLMPAMCALQLDSPVLSDAGARENLRAPLTHPPAGVPSAARELGPTGLRG
jgi:hypothetical protein